MDEKRERKTPLLTVREASQFLAVSRSTVDRLIACGSLPAILLRSGKKKKTFRIREEALERWLRQRENRK
jgi:excisionase family DNA binding protein